jgi:tetratricopeptide (TPR) repeat protein
MDTASLLREALERHRDGDVPAALLRYRAVLAREPCNAAAVECCAALLVSLGRFGDAARACGDALAADPSSAVAAQGLMAALRGELTQAAKEGRAADVVAAADRLIDLDYGADPLAAAWERAQFRLLAGDFESGLELFESRLRLPSFIGQGRLLAAPRWDGRPYPGKTLLLHGEQGYGDTIMMLRHMKRAKELGGTLLAFVQAPLGPVAATCEGPDVVFDSVGGPPVAFDLQLPMMSLPYALGIDGAGAPARPYLGVPGRVPGRGRIDAIMAGAGPREKKIGIVWAGRPDHKRDGERSVPPGLLSPLAGAEGASWFALQRELPDFAPFPGATPLGGALGTFADTAYALSRLDLLVTVDTSTAHLAGAMGVPTMLMVTCVPDWRWGLARRSSPLYPSVRLFRQGEPGDWAGVIAEVAAELRRPPGPRAPW